MLFSEKIISLEELGSVIENIEQTGQIQNPLDKKLFTKSSHWIHSQELERQIATLKLDSETILLNLKELLRVQSQNDESREVSKEETSHPFKKIKFIPLSSKSLDHKFEVMTTAVTEFMWLEYMGDASMDLAPFGLDINEEVISITRNGRELRISPDIPMQSITWWSAVVFANRLSEKKGLVPVYDLREVQFDPSTSAEAGDLRALEGTFKINAPGENIYEALGYRLPTAAEMKVYFPEDIGIKELEYREDFLLEWSQDSRGREESLAKKDRLCMHRKYNNKSLICSSGSMAEYDPNTKYWSVGFRLVRTIH